MVALTALEMCMKNCGHQLHVMVAGAYTRPLSGST